MTGRTTWATNRKNFAKGMFIEAEHFPSLTEASLRSRRKPTGVAYFGQGAEWHHNWITGDPDPLGPVPHTDWESEAFLAGGWAK